MRTSPRAATSISTCSTVPARSSASAARGHRQEEVNLLNPAADTYTVYVHGFNVAGTTNFKLHSWVLGSAAAGNMTVTAPATATLGATGAINLTFNGLAPATKVPGLGGVQRLGRHAGADDREGDYAVVNDQLPTSNFQTVVSELGVGDWELGID